MYYSSGNYEAFARPQKAGGCGQQIGLHIGAVAWPRWQQPAIWCATDR